MTSTETRSTPPLTAARRLIARTTPLPEDVIIDLLAVGGAPDALLWQLERSGLAGRGEALRLPLPHGLDEPDAAARIVETLAAIDVDGPFGPVAIGALPFDRQAPAHLLVPSVMVRTDESGRQWLTTVGPPYGAAPDLAALTTLPPIEPPDRFSLVSARSHADWCDVVARTVDTIRAGHLDKVVLAREIRVEANGHFVPADILRRLHALYPSCMVFAVEGFVGASPELLVSRRGGQVRSHPLAGTVARSGDRQADDRLVAGMLGSAKQRHEHRLVIQAVSAALTPLCSWLDVPDVPSIVSLRNVSHLGTLLQGELAGDPPPTALELVARLHPTPAVAGTPTADAVAYLREMEGFDRGRYAGAVGWMDAEGDGEWAVGIRSAELQANTARLFAGNGVVSDSDPQAELAETQLKLQALLAAVVRP
jgi:menaquinone-specific isochorismate synthase